MTRVFDLANPLQAQSLFDAQRLASELLSGDPSRVTEAVSTLESMPPEEQALAIRLAIAEFQMLPPEQQMVLAMRGLAIFQAMPPELQRSWLTMFARADPASFAGIAQRIACANSRDIPLAELFAQDLMNGPRSFPGYKNRHIPRAPHEKQLPFDRLRGSTDGEPVKGAKVYKPGSPEQVELFERAARKYGLDPSWARSPALQNILARESGGVVGRPNYTYGARANDRSQWDSIHQELKAGHISAKSSATGLGQLLVANVDRYYPHGRAGIGDPEEEAAGMMRYIQSRYGTPENAWERYGRNHEGY
jgi:hypothetical protein